MKNVLVEMIYLILLFVMFVAYLIQLFRGRAIDEVEEYAQLFSHSSLETPRFKEIV